jgi:DNA-binding transcriptional ArsR family regulator
MKKRRNQTISAEKCEIKYIHEDKVNSARTALHSHSTTQDLAETFKILSDPTRINITLALSKEELCVCDIAALLSMTESAISHQIRLLKNLRLVKYRRAGKMTYYSLDDEHIDDLIRVAVRHVSEP